MAVDIFFSDSDKIGSMVIRLVTWSEWSHCGFIDPATETVIDSRWALGGVTEYPVRDLLASYPRIERYRVPGLPDECLGFARSQVGKPYDWTALFNFVTRRNWQEENAWFCSELMLWAMLKANFKLTNKDAWRISPQDCYEGVIWD